MIAAWYGDDCFNATASMSTTMVTVGIQVGYLAVVLRNFSYFQSISKFENTSRYLMPLG